MRKIGLTLAAVAALATTAVVNSPAEARGGRNAAIGFGVAAGVLGAAAPANATTTVTMALGTGTTVVDPMRITAMARDTIDAATIATTTIGKEEPGAIRAFSLSGYAAKTLVAGLLKLKANRRDFLCLPVIRGHSSVTQVSLAGRERLRRLRRLWRAIVNLWLMH